MKLETLLYELAMPEKAPKPKPAKPAKASKPEKKKPCPPKRSGDKVATAKRPGRVHQARGRNGK
ncbi:hypothetical protein [Bauldia sp.]|uniref:hypothetical protein n=1 Tax=Bauldia sp. TaxID=2575872 RepID=UPI003BAB673C